MKPTSGLFGRIALVVVLLTIYGFAADPSSDRQRAGAAPDRQSQEIRELKAEIEDLRNSLLETQLDDARLRNRADRVDKTLEPIRYPVPPEVDRGMMIIDRRGQVPPMRK